MKRIIKFFLILSLFLVPLAAKAEQTVGLFLNTEESYKGYTLFSPVFYNVSYLLDNQGMLVHSWTSNYYPGMMAYLSEDGYLYRSIVAGKSSRFDDFGGGVEKLDWDGNVVWYYEYASELYRQHHDICVLPSGNVLMIVWEYKDITEGKEAGRDTFELHPGGIWSEGIIEVEPVGDKGGKIVWEWHAWDHIIQDFDSSKISFGVVEDHPELINLNYPGYKASVDWIHLNSVAYNAKLDQIILSSREFSEVWVIDHSTTTAEARGHTGGRYGKGGDFLYRWGNPSAYNQGTDADQYLIKQHDAHWIADGLPGAGNILVFNNYNITVDEFTAPVDTEGFYTGGLPWGPNEPVWTYIVRDYYVTYVLSGAQRLPNGNTLVSYGPSGILSEVTPEGEQVWRYVNPVTSLGPVAQGDTVRKVPPINGIFKARRYPPDYPAFVGKDLSPKGPIELAGVSESAAEPKKTALHITSNVCKSPVKISYQIGTTSSASIILYDVLGREIRTILDETKSAGEYLLNWEGSDNAGRMVSPGVYFVVLKTDYARDVMRIIFTK